MLKKLIVTTAVAVAIAGNASAQQTAQNPQRADSLYVATYDFEQKDYYKCIDSIVANTPREYINCLTAEVKRQDTAMRQFIAQLLTLDTYKKWNNGNDMFRGNMKDMLDQYMAYRERLCSMYGLAYKDLLNDPEHGRRKCMMEVNDQMLRKLQEIYGTSISDFSSEEDFEPGTI